MLSIVLDSLTFASSQKIFRQYFEVNAFGWLKNIGGMFILYYMHSEVCSRCKTLTWVYSGISDKCLTL